MEMLTAARQATLACSCSRRLCNKATCQMLIDGVKCMGRGNMFQAVGTK